MLLEASGVKGLDYGGAQISEHHANFIFNRDSASSRDILELSFIMRQAVFDRFGVWLEYEMEILGHLPPDLMENFSQIRAGERNKSELEILKRDFQEMQKQSDSNTTCQNTSY